MYKPLVCGFILFFLLNEPNKPSGENGSSVSPEISPTHAERKHPTEYWSAPYRSEEIIVRVGIAPDRLSGDWPESQTGLHKIAGG
jgi:hypothetical protein